MKAVEWTGPTRAVSNSTSNCEVTSEMMRALCSKKSTAAASMPLAACTSGVRPFCERMHLSAEGMLLALTIFGRVFCRICTTTVHGA